MKHKWITAIYGFVIGAAMVVTWIALFVTGQAEPLRCGFTAHLFSELLTAVFMIVAGVLIMAGRRTQRWVTYFGFGLLLNATLGAFVFYIVNFSIGIFLMSFLSFAVTVVLAAINYERLRDLTFLTLGVVLYACINIGGEALESIVQGPIAQSLWGILTYISLAFVSVVVLLIIQIRRDKD
ncbi:hypothetical protein GF359_05800 [candidate division WOR-3 bacterium]|uniref:DUF8058 domain-containing protein n=1 Tax=candidate division WOR-3 bacterium TaxID=2052148 RepID=A0A9D5K988_UNCW3|nr:hypothetical protein [candidate division WOR-3 bacterium]MBD3364711.1 hypothetical protein [candidate division WOR-3 bacterium]